MKNIPRSILSSSAFVALLMAPSLHAADSSWNVNAAGNWADAGNWSAGVPGATSGTTNADIATFGSVINANRTITVDSNRNIGGITFVETEQYTLDGGSLILSQDGNINAGGARSIRIFSDITLAGNGGIHTFTGNGGASGRRLLVTGSVTAGAFDTTLNLATASTSVAAVEVTGSISDGAQGGSLSVTKGSNGSAILAGANTYSGNTVVNAGTLILAETGSLTFNIGASGVNNSVSGVGTATFDGSFVLDLTNADTAGGSSWTLVDLGSLSIATSFSDTFDIVGFSATGNVWSNGLYSFDESTGILSTIPEPSTYASILGGLALAGVTVRRRRA